MADFFPGWVTRVRKDPLGAAGYNRLLARYAWTEDLFAAEHLLDAGGLTIAGEHNAAEVPREVGSCYMTGGTVANIEGFRYAVSANRSALGTFDLTLNPDPYASIFEMAPQVTNMSESGSTKPCITSAVLTSTSLMSFFSKYLSSALGAGNTWAAQDSHFCAAIHASPFPPGLRAVKGVRKTRGDWLTEATTDLNAQIQADADLRSKFDVGHKTGNGVHDVPEVARTWASITWDGVTCASTSSSINAVLTSVRNSIGDYTITWRTAWALPAQPFVMVDYARNNGGVITDTYVICCPRSSVTTTAVRFFIYKYDFGAMTWARADSNFSVVVHGN